MEALATKADQGSHVISIQELLDRGYSIAEISATLGAPKKEIQQIIRHMNADRTLLEEYRRVQPLQLTMLQHKLLSGITEQKIMDAPLRDIVGAFKTLKDKELVMDGKPTEIHGLVGYLDHLEKEERGEIDVTPSPVDEGETSNIDTVAANASNASNDEDLPCL